MRWLLSLCLVGLFAQQAVGQVTDVTWNPFDPVIGVPVTFSTVGQAPNGYMAATKWEVRYAASQPNYGGDHDPLDWTLVSDFGAGSCHIDFYIPGNFEVRATVHYTSWQIPPGDPINDTVITKTVTLPAPNNLEILGGMDDPSSFNQPIVIQYRIRTGTTAIGTMSSGSVQYKFIDIWQLNPPFSPTYPDDWEGWYSDQFLTRYGSLLYDSKSLTAEQIAGMSQITVGYTFLRFTQPMRYVWQTEYDEWFSSSLGSVGMEVYKYDSEQWAITEQ